MEKKEGGKKYCNIFSFVDFVYGEWIFFSKMNRDVNMSKNPSSKPSPSGALKEIHLSFDN